MRVLFLTIALVGMVMSGCRIPTAVSTPRQAQKQTFSEERRDGLPENMEFHKNSGFHYDFQHDENNLYLRLATSDPGLQRKMINFGFTVWIDKTGKKEKEQGFRFPMGVRTDRGPGDARPSYSPPTGMGSRAGSMDQMLAGADEIVLIGIYGTSERTVKMRDSRIRVKAEIKDELLVYEAVVPYEIIQLGYSPLAGNTKMSIGLETGHFEAPSAERRPQSPYGGRPGDRMMPPPGGMPGQRPQERSELTKPTRLWLNLEFKHM